MTIMDKAFKGISMIQFYKWGSILFSIGLIGSAINAKISWEVINIGGKISMLSGFCFQALLLSLFLTLYFQIKNQPKVVTNPEVDKFLEKLKETDSKEVKGGIQNGKQKNNIKN